MMPADARTAAWLDRVLAAAPPLGGAQAAAVRAVIAPAMKQAAPATETRAAQTAPQQEGRTVNAITA